MANLKEKLDHALNECRMLVLVVEVMLAFQYQSFYQKGFDSLPISVQFLKLAGLVSMLIAAALLIWPVPYHRIAERCEETPALHEFINIALYPALFLFASSLAVDVYIAGLRIHPGPLAVAVAVSAATVALIFWYGIPIIDRGRPENRRHWEEHMNVIQAEDHSPHPAKLPDEVKQALTEARVVLPGIQALLGFQFAVVLTESFEKAPQPLKYIHLVSLLLVGVSTILLMAPAAYHRIVLDGEDTEEFLRLCGNMVLSSMAFLAAGVCGDLYVVAAKVLRSDTAAAALACAMLALFLGMWFGYTLYRRHDRGRRLRAARPAEAR